MRSLLVVLDHPPPGGFPNVVEAREQILVEHLLAEGTVESFDEGVLVGFAGLDVLDRHALALGPLLEVLAQEVRSIVGTQHLRQSTFALELFEHPDQAR